ncbi:MAG: hypothetical protein AB7E72_07440 [Lysobacterales bacterium]
MSPYGFKRLALLGSAGYRRAELPLDAAVSLIAPNNAGKTSLINALQFLLIVDRRQMDFGAHDLETSRRFYFPNNSAYILLEVALPHGSVVLGCVGKGVGHDYSYFAYRGQLELDDFRLPSGAQVAQPQLHAHLARSGKLVHSYSTREFTEAIFGSRRRASDNEPDITLFKLDHPSQADAYRRVLTRTLRLDRLRSAEVKDYLLTIFRRDLPDSDIDFKAEWDKAFAEVNADRAQYEAALRQRGQIEAMEQLQGKRLTLRGKLLVQRPQLDHLLAAWQAHYERSERELAERIKAVESELDEQLTRVQSLSESRANLTRQLGEANQRQQRCLELENEFALLSGRADLESALQLAQTRLDQQTAHLHSASSRSAAAIAREIEAAKREQEQLQRTQAHLSHNLYLYLQSTLEAPQLERLNRALSAQVLTLGSEGFSADAPALQQWLASADDTLELPGLRLQLGALKPQHSQPDAAELAQRLSEVEAQIARLNQELATARDLAQAQREKDRLQDDVDHQKARLARYDEYRQLAETSAARQQELGALDEQLQQTHAQIERARGHDRALRQNERELQGELQALRDDHRVIVQRREQRRDDGPTFVHLADLPHTPWISTKEPGLAQLRGLLESYLSDCSELLRLDQQLETLRAQLHAGGLTKFQFLGGSEQEIGRMIDFASLLPQEAEALERKARSAVVNVTLCLRELRDGLLAFQSRMRDFNRLVNRRQLSDLSVFRIDPVEETALVEAINALISTAEQVQSGQSFELFNHATVLDDATVNRAKSLLIRVGEEKGCLRVEHLFRLQFVVGKKGRPEEAFGDIDSAASNGTVLMAKLVTGLALLHLMQDKRHQVQAVCYVDEASALDLRNQRHLIDTAAEFGFALIFASPTPLVTARYCVPITTVNGDNHISWRSWQILEPLNEDTPA